VKEVHKKKKVWLYLLIEVLVLAAAVAGFIAWKKSRKEDKIASNPVIEEKNEANTENKTESKIENKSENKTENKKPSAQESDYEALGIKAYEYPLEFSLGDDLKSAVIQLALLYEDFDQTVVLEKDWKDTFIAAFIQNSRFSFTYLDQIAQQHDGQIGIRELNYIQKSLTNIDVDFSSDVKDSVNRYDDASAMTYGNIVGYQYKEADDRVSVIADLEVGADGTDAVTNREVTVTLIKNPYSCFDGYSIESIATEEDAAPVEQDGEEHVFYGTDMMEEENGVFPLEFISSEDDLNYAHFVYVDLTELPDLADFVRQNAGANFKVTYELSGDEVNPIEEVVPKDVTLQEK